MELQSLSADLQMPTKERAEREATELLQATWFRGEGCPLPVDPFEIARTLGLRVSVVALEPDVSGMLAKRPYQDAEVYINASDGLNRQRFSCAHEIGHYNDRATEKDDDGWGYIDRRGPSAGTGQNPSEVYANQFAAALLMPEQNVRELLTRSPGAAAMAIEFGVSLEAMKFRIENIGS